MNDLEKSVDRVRKRVMLNGEGEDGMQALNYLLSLMLEGQIEIVQSHLAGWLEQAGLSWESGANNTTIFYYRMEADEQPKRKTP